MFYNIWRQATLYYNIHYVLQHSEHSFEFVLKLSSEYNGKLEVNEAKSQKVRDDWSEWHKDRLCLLLGALFCEIWGPVAWVIGKLN